MPSLYQNVVLNNLKQARVGSIEVHLPNGEIHKCGANDSAKSTTFRIHNTETFKMVALNKGIGLGEAYQHGYWSSDDLCGLLQWFCVNLQDISPNITPAASKALSGLLVAADTLTHWRRRNTIDQSRRNIHAHYDLGNDFYKLFLDPTMTYSSAFFTSETQSLEQAQEEKYDRICRKLDLQPYHHLLEIGCGWGGFAMYAATHYGCKITGITISEEQLKEAQKRVANSPVRDRIEIRFADYRTLEGKFDRIASIEMLEAVGEKYLGQYFEQVERLLKPEGLAAVQVITTPNPIYKGYRKRVDWIQKHIFPGSHLPSSRRLLEAAESSGNLDLLHQETFGLHYAKTLNLWRRRFLSQWGNIEQQGFDEAFKRKWEFYFAYCEAGFLQRHINVMQMVFGRPDEPAYNFEERSHSQSNAGFEKGLSVAS
ncbi:SAM-dependent methyltransferase [Pelagicoccus albus]|uniref:Class I SAM-dependent methyltransferase n=1 Tax=Pelagicoccus albus TaxID=415222 RepID=A0A7X1B9T9_9BACT|nr:cyclopropane-fatty-acyl-phospholipid synthase family protein [Pelagicoccus albus]MBC2607989.1 class I SAM-dependent methyltransferase [Pelagicoccus albus]